MLTSEKVVIPRQMYDRLVSMQQSYRAAGGQGDGPMMDYLKVVDQAQRDIQAPVRIGQIR